MTSPRRRPAGAVAIVTGAAGATGRSVLRTLAEQGVVVVALDASVQGLADEEDLYPGQVLPFTADVTAPGAAACAVALVAERLGAPQILVHLAGQLTHPTRGELTESMWGLERALHVDAGVEFTRAVLPLMEGAGWGRSCTWSTRTPTQPGTVGTATGPVDPHLSSASNTARFRLPAASP